MPATWPRSALTRSGSRSATGTSRTTTGRSSSRRPASRCSTGPSPTAPGTACTSILDLHALPGGQNRHWHCDNPTHHPAFWDHRHFQDRAVHLWEALADRYRGNPAVAGYNIMNEPADIDGDRIKPFYDRVVAAVREVDPGHILFLDGNRYGTEFAAFRGFEPYGNAVYAAHDYHLPGFGYGGPYPGVTRGTYVDRAQVERIFLERTQFMRDTGTPIWIGEFGPVFTGDPDRDEQRYQLLQDQLDLYAEHGAGWAIWAYKDLGGEGVVSAAADSPWCTRIREVTEKKARLGVDGWGSTDAGVRHITGPVEETFAKEYPDFSPFPFGLARLHHPAGARHPAGRAHAGRFPPLLHRHRR